MSRNFQQCKFIKKRTNIQCSHHVTAVKKDPTRVLCAFHYDYVNKHWTPEQIENFFYNDTPDRPLIGRPKNAKNKPKQYEIYNYTTNTFDIVKTLKELGVLSKEKKYQDPITGCNQIKKN